MNLRQALERFGPVTEHGDEFLTTCPECRKAQHFYVNRRKLKGYCQRCGYRVGPRWIGRLLGGDLDETTEDRIRELLRNDRAGTDALALPDETGYDFGTRTGRCALRYWMKRGLSTGQLESYRVGYCASGRYEGRLIIPVYERGELVYFQARSFGVMFPPYLNPPRGRGRGKSEVVFNLDSASGTGTAVVTEGVFDAMAVGPSGVSLFGKFASGAQLGKLAERGLSEVYVMLDSEEKDPDIPHQARALARQLASYLLDVTVRVCRLPHGDPGSSSREDISRALARATPLTLCDIVL